MKKTISITAAALLLFLASGNARAQDCDKAKANMKEANGLITSNPSRAESLYSEAVRLCPKSAGAYYNLGLMQYDRGDLAQAASSFKNALEIKPDFVEAINGVVLSYAAQGINYNEAKGLIERALNVRPKDQVLLETAKVLDASKKPPFLSISSIALKEPTGTGMLNAEDTGKITVTVKNTGKGPAFVVNLGLETEGGSIKGLSMNEKSYIGQLSPGEEKTVSINIKAADSIPTSNVNLKAALSEAKGFDSQPVVLSFKTKEFMPPKLQIAKVDIQDADGKRVITKGKEAEVTITVQNAGQGIAKGVEAVLDLKDKEVKSFGDNRVQIGTLMPGETKKATFNIAVTNRYGGAKTLPVSFSLKEERDKFSARPDVKLALNEDAPEMKVVKVEAKETPALKTANAEDVEDVPSFNADKKIIGQNDLAVIIGIEQYKHAPKSEFSYSDAKLVKNYLKAMGFAERNIEFHTNDDATGTTIRKSIESWLPNRVKKDSKVFVYYSGHGAPDPGTGEAYLVPNDGDPDYLQDTGYSLKRLYEKLGKLPTNNVVVVLDSCFSGSGGRSVLAKNARPISLINESVVPPNVTVLSATQGTQISASSNEKGHGIFTYYFLKSIKDGKKDLAEVYKYLKPLVEDEAKAQNVNQSPTMNPEPERVKGKFSLVK